jgi:cystathionine beta-lyase/cystathionine gamma-synthase
VLTHHIMDADARAGAGISDRLIGLSIGLEDLWADLDQALREAA